MGITASFGAATQWWAVYYSDHQMVSLVVRYIHVAALMVGGGTALAIDRLVLGSARARTADRQHAALNALHGSHIVVVPALIVVAASGVLMAAADWPTFEASNLFWIKMGSFVLLLANGAALVGAERAFAKGGDTRMWRRVILASGTSFLLWLFWSSPTRSPRSGRRRWSPPSDGRSRDPVFWRGADWNDRSRPDGRQYGAPAHA